MKVKFKEADEALRLLYPTIWIAIKYHRTHRNETVTFGEPFRCVKEMYFDNSPYIVVSKCTQMGMSEMLVARAFSETAMEGRNLFYVLPNGEIRTRFVQNRFDKSVIYSGWYGQQMKHEGKKVESVNLKHIGKGAISFVGSQTPTVFTEFPADSIFIDEYDQCNQDNLAMADERLSASTNKRRRYVSNPTIMNFGIHNEYMKSDRKKWFIKCDHCDKWVSPDFFKHVVREVGPREYVIIDEDYDPNGKRDCRVICHHCQKPLSRYKDGQWVRTQKSDISGYTTSKVFSSNVTIREMLTRFEDGLKDDSKLQRFYNGDIGVPYTASGAKITKDMLDGCVRDYQCQPSSKTACIIGIDVGTKLHTVVSELQADGSLRLIFAGELDGFEDIRDAHRNYNIKAGVVDAAPETRLSKKICGLRGMFRCFYTNSAKVDHINTSDRVVTVDRTSSLDIVKEAIISQTLLLPVNAANMAPIDSNGISRLYNHITVNTRYLDESGNDPKYVWTEGTAADHFFHALNYMMIAKRMIKAI